MLTSGARPRLAYLPGLDGLRALAVAAVLLYHHDPHLLPAGFLGVELFFVLSGYLITSLLSAEWQTTGRIRLGAFWLSRARRLFAALLVLVVVVLLVGVLWLRDELAQLRADALASLLYVMNWRLVLDERPYFASFGRPSLLLHLWSLAIEGQFYLIWPLALAAGLVRYGRRTMLGLALAGAALAALLMALLFVPEADPARVYYGTDTRSSGLLLGAALALVWKPRQDERDARRGGLLSWLDGLGLLALLGLGLLFSSLHPFTPLLYRGGFLLVGCCAALAIAAVVHPQARLLNALLGFAPLRWIGTRSYSLYLWHWPVFMLTRPGLDLPLEGLPLLTLRLGLSLGLAELSYRLVEVPVRQGALGRAWTAQQAAIGSRRLALTTSWLALVAAGLSLVLWIGVQAALAPPPRPPAYLEALATPVMSPGPAVLVLPTLPALTPPPPLAVTPLIAVVPTAIFAGPPYELIAPPVSHGGPATTRDPRGPLPTPTPLPTVALPPPLPPTLAIGDSIMLGASAALANAIPSLEVDAVVSRQVGELIAILSWRREAGLLPPVVVVHLGNNGYVSPEQAEQLLRLLESVPRVVLVNTSVPRIWEAPTNGALAAAAANHANVVFVDWRAASAGRYDLFWDDGVHLRPEGASFFAELIAAAAAR